MQIPEVLKLASELYTLLKDKEKAVDTEVAKVSQLKSEADEEKNKQVSISNALNARTRILDNREQELVAREKKVDKLDRIQDKLESSRLKDIEVSNREKAVAIKEEEVVKLRAISISKANSNDKLKIELEEEKKNLKESILEELRGKL